MRWSIWRALGLAMVLAVGVGVLPLCANDTVVGSVGGKWQPLNSEHIRMVSETIKARLDRDRAHVTCEFLLENEGPAQKVKVGFPQELGTAPLHGFRCWVDRAEVQVESRVAKASKERIREKAVLGNPYEGWHWWWMSFEPGQVRRVSHTYEAEYTEDTMGGRAFSYIVRTGATWKGSIGKALIEVDLGPIVTQPYSAQPQGYETNGNRIVWQWEEFEPEDDIRVAWAHNPRMYFSAMHAKRGVDYPQLQLPIRDCMRDGVAFAPLRWLADSVGAECQWDAASSRATLIPKSGRKFRIRPGSSQALTDWGPVALGAEVYSLKGQIMVPVRPLANWLGLGVRFTPGLFPAVAIIAVQ